MTAQPAHAAGGRTPPANAFSCWTPTYVGKPAHNEIAVCFSGSDSTDVHFSYWYDATAHTTHHTMPWEFSAAPHNYTVVWAPTRLTFLVDGAVVQTVDGTTSTIPSAAGHELLILRPKTDAFIADSAFAVAFASYDPAY